jgi:formate hydrogenlyase subunit 3/multisubunit Na+/H+ antiporter MnhD subunit
MSAPLIWIFLPGLVSGVLFLVRRWERVVILIGSIVALLLTLFAWQLPIGETIETIGIPSFTIRESVSVLGRAFLLTNADRPILILIYLGAALWIGGARIAAANRMFTPIGLAISGLLTASLAVEPFLYAALLIELAVLVSVPLLSPPGDRIGRGVLRYLTFLTLGMPFILFTGWLFVGVEANPGDPTAIVRAIVPLLLGFAFLIGIFPFHTWIPMIAEESHPYTAAFIFFVLPGVISIFGLSFLVSYPWLQSIPLMNLSLRLLGLLMVFTGGVWAAFQHNLGRMMGYAVMVDIGLSLLAISLGTGSLNGQLSASIPGPPRSTGLFFPLLPARAIGLTVWALALATLRSHSSGQNFRSIQGLARKMPIASAALILAHFSFAGLPLLAGFPVQLALWSALATQSLPAALVGLVGIIGLMAGAIRSLAVLTMGSEEARWEISESRWQILLLSVGMLMILLLGLLPHAYIPILSAIGPF